ncbi:MAG TPA: restriction endonuclease subunit S, partial [Candidatus Methylomirabilis sp.]|nr:restriction endonuclease subunit S [Candidatus Methylomirabilis sp.]
MAQDPSPIDESLARSWRLLKFAEVASYTLGRTPPRRNPAYWPVAAGIPWVTISDMTPYSTVHATAESVSSTAVAEIFRCPPVSAGTLLMSFKLTIGRTAVLGVNAYHNEAIIAIRPKAGVDRDFLRYYLPTIDFAQHQDRAIKGQTLNKGKIETLPVVLPPLPEQRAIVGALSKVQAAVEVQDKILATLRALKTATMGRLFREGLRGEPLKQTEIGEIPESWDIVPLGEVATIERGKFAHRPRNDPQFYGGSTPFIQTGDVAKCNGRVRRYSQTLNERGLAISRLFPKGTIVLTIAANIGDTGIIEFDSAFPDSVVGITPAQGIHAVFLEYYLRTQKGEMNRLAPKGTQKNINIQFLKPWPTPCPSVEEQREMA